MNGMNGKKLYRSKNDRLIIGVCGGLGEYLGINSNIIRFIFVVSTYFSGGVSIFLYIILGNTLPEEGQEGKKRVPYKGWSGIGNLINIIDRLNNQTTKNSLENNQNGIESGRIKKTISSQEIKNKYFQKDRIELEGHQNRSGIDFDWRSKIMILLLILGVLFLLWKFGFIGTNFNINF